MAHRSTRGETVVVVSEDAPDTVTFTEIAAGELRPKTFARAELPERAAIVEASRPRWVWSDAALWYRRFLEAGVHVGRCSDLRLSRAILRRARLTKAAPLRGHPLDAWDKPPSRSAASRDDGLFQLDEHRDADPVAEWHRQQASAPAELALLLSAESAGALAATEMNYIGLPWRADLHQEWLVELLGPRPIGDARPAKLEVLAVRIRELLNAPRLNPDSPAALLSELRRAGLDVTSTRSWELQQRSHPVIGPLLDYKRLARTLSANGWAWLDNNVVAGRFHPEFVPGGVVTGRWASAGGGGALQLPKNVRGAVVADPGHTFVVADASQLEPRILAALSGDQAMIAAARAGDLYEAVVASGAVATREQAKLALLGAMYGATSGESGRLLPGLSRTYPRAVRVVEAAAQAGERGEVVSTWLGRTSPLPDERLREVMAQHSEAPTPETRSAVRTWGRFTRNFVVQGTAAEWALCWMATLRAHLARLGGPTWLSHGPHLVFFLHDELVIHCRLEQADEVAALVRESAVTAGRLLFPEVTASFPLSVVHCERYGDAP